MQFTTCAIIITPLNYIWQQNLEATLPGKTPANAAPKHEEKSARPEPKTSEPSLNVTNTITKIVIDQIIGGTWNTVLFILTIGLLRGQHYELVFAQIREVSLILLCQLGPSSCAIKAFILGVMAPRGVGIVRSTLQREYKGQIYRFGLFQYHRLNGVKVCKASSTVADIMCHQEFWPIMVVGFKFWPLVSILNFTVVPVDQRLLVGSLFGVVWAVYLSLVSG